MGGRRRPRGTTTKGSTTVGRKAMPMVGGGGGVRRTPSPNVVFDKAELRGRLTPVEFQVTQEKQTERPYSNKFNKHREEGAYHCKVCSEALFSSRAKYEAKTGWPSFYDVVDKSKVTCKEDASGLGGNLLLLVSRPDMIRTEVSCRNCGSHLGHVFRDGPKPTGQRYCVNSSSLDFVPSDETDGKAGQEDVPVIECPATLGGCGGPNGTCSLKPKPAEPKDGIVVNVPHPTSIQ